MAIALGAAEVPAAKEKTFAPFAYRSTLFGFVKPIDAAAAKYSSGEEPAAGETICSEPPSATLSGPAHFRTGTPLLAADTALNEAPLSTDTEAAICALVPAP